MPAFSARGTARKPKSIVSAGLLRSVLLRSVMVGHHRLRGGNAEPMPELPEVETVMRGLAAVLQGRMIRAAAISRPDLRWPFPDGLAARLVGSRVEGFRRRAKYMLMRLSGGDS